MQSPKTYGMIQSSEVRKLISWICGMFQKYRDIILYLIFGVLTTAVNWAVYYPLFNLVGWSGGVSKTIAWVAAVIFAYLTNKPFVFCSHDWSAKVVLPEFLKFIGCRVGSGLLEIGVIFLTVDLLHWNGNVMNVIVSVFVVIINYIGSKLSFKNADKGK